MNTAVKSNGISTMQKEWYGQLVAMIDEALKAYTGTLLTYQVPYGYTADREVLYEVQSHYLEEGWDAHFEYIDRHDFRAPYAAFHFIRPGDVARIEGTPPDEISYTIPASLVTALEYGITFFVLIGLIYLLARIA